jgi:hypothetical protein
MRDARQNDEILIFIMTATLAVTGDIFEADVPDANHVHDA